MAAANSTMAGAFEFIKEIMGTACTHNVNSTPRRRCGRGCRAGQQLKIRRQREGSEPAPRAPSPAPDDSTVLSSAPEVLNVVLGMRLFLPK